MLKKGLKKFFFKVFWGDRNILFVYFFKPFFNIVTLAFLIFPNDLSSQKYGFKSLF
jgi:hypothetical protein